MDLQLKGKVVLVTGGAKGIGAAIVRGCAAEEAVAVIVDRDVESGRQLRLELESAGKKAGFISADLTSVGTALRRCSRRCAILSGWMCW